MEIKSVLESLSNEVAISGHESGIESLIKNLFKDYVDEIFVDKFGNISCLKKGSSGKKKIMIAAHVDEIGLMVKSIEEGGFIRFTNMGGFDPRTILGQRVIIHGKKDILGVVGSKPPHLQTPEEQTKAIKLEDLLIDSGYEKDELEKLVSLGDVISIDRKLVELEANRFAGKALDNRTGVLAMYLAAKELANVNHEADVYFVSTVQEEVHMLASLITYDINPDLGIAVDVGFGRTPELKDQDSLELGKGPGITLGGNIHKKLRRELLSTARTYNIPNQVEISPGPTGTDGRAIQITREGIPTLVVSIPLKYMHTSVELVDLKDIEDTGRLLASFIKNLTNEKLEGCLCY